MIWCKIWESQRWTHLRMWKNHTFDKCLPLLVESELSSWVTNAFPQSPGNYWVLLRQLKRLCSCRTSAGVTRKSNLVSATSPRPTGQIRQGLNENTHSVSELPLCPCSKHNGRTELWLNWGISSSDCVHVKRSETETNEKKKKSVHAQQKNLPLTNHY